MPCEACQVQFTVLRRKRSCSECKRFYCNNCLTASKRQQRTWRCARCAIFVKRPLLRSDLLQLKPKDLIFYLQSKHISTAGCVEKDELIGLILNHVQQHQGAEQSSSGSSPSNSHKSQKEPGHSFDSLKQSCQNFFTNISDNINDSLAALDGKSGTSSNKTSHKQRRGRAANGSNGENITTQQPRMTRRREMRAYSACQNATPTAPAMMHTTASGNNSHNNGNSSGSGSSNNSSSTVSPTHNSMHTAAANTNEALAQVTIEDCECSENEDDDDILATYNEHLKAKKTTDAMRRQSQEFSTNIELVADITGSSPGSSSSNIEEQNAEAPAPTHSQNGNKLTATEVNNEETSQSSSFEELGAIGGSANTATGGISDDSKATTDTNSSNLEQWQLLDVPTEADQPTFAETVQQTATQSHTHCAASVPERNKKVTRRRSESFLKHRQALSDDEESADNQAAAVVAAASSSCQRCGKNKTNIRRHVERMRQHLESAQMSEEDIKRELAEFLNYLEQRTKSIDCSDTETAASSLHATPCESRLQAEIQQQQDPDQAHMYSELDFAAIAAALLRDIELGNSLSDDEGINVYASDRGDNTSRPSRFISLHSIGSLEELENLTVKQLKEVLTLNRVDYKGCCEKQELLERVTRLWKTLKEAPEIEKLPTDELCKICMDAPIECVILECGHMATCTSCGKVLSECPICRQYIVRVVRFFKA